MLGACGIREPKGSELYRHRCFEIASRGSDPESRFHRMVNCRTRVVAIDALGAVPRSRGGHDSRNLLER
jgi:hypothetical protein